jgi:hypothetical protein
MGIIETMNNANIKFFWNGLKVAGDRKMSVKGFWSYEGAHTGRNYSTPEHVTFYADSACGGDSGEICKSFGGSAYTCGQDDSYTPAQFDLTPADPRWADAMAAAIVGAQRTLVRMERAADKRPTPYNRQECTYQQERIARLQAAATPAACLCDSVVFCEAHKPAPVVCVNPVFEHCLCDGTANGVCYPNAAGKAAQAAQQTLARLEALIGPL